MTEPDLPTASAPAAGPTRSGAGPLGRPSEAARVAEAVATGVGLEALARSLTDPSLLAVVEAARARLAPALSEQEARLLRAIGAFPGCSAQELRDVTLLTDAEWATASASLLTAGLVESTRFDVPDCWSRTARGTAVARALPPVVPG